MRTEPKEERNVIAAKLMPPDKIIFPLHIKLGLMKQFVKSLDQEGDCFQYICKAFPSLSNETLKAGILMDVFYILLI